MEQDFELPVIYNKKELLLPAKLIKFGYSYTIEITINTIVISFEKDEERKWRAILDQQEIEHTKGFTKELLQRIIETLEELF